MPLPFAKHGFSDTAGKRQFRNACREIAREARHAEIGKSCRTADVPELGWRLHQLEVGDQFGRFGDKTIAEQGAKREVVMRVEIIGRHFEADALPQQAVAPRQSCESHNRVLVLTAAEAMHLVGKGIGLEFVDFALPRQHDERLSVSHRPASTGIPDSSWHRCRSASGWRPDALRSASRGPAPPSRCGRAPTARRIRWW